MSKAWRLGRLSALLIGLLTLAGAVAEAADIYAPQTLDHYFRLEWSKDGRNVNGYVYSSATPRTCSSPWKVWTVPERSSRRR